MRVPNILSAIFRSQMIPKSLHIPAFISYDAPFDQLTIAAPRAMFSATSVYIFAWSYKKASPPPSPSAASLKGVCGERIHIGTLLSTICNEQWRWNYFLAGGPTCKGVATHLPPNSCFSSDFGHFILENGKS